MLALALTGQALIAEARAAGPDPEKTRELVAILQSDASLEARARACQQLALVGTKEAVPALAALLGDEKLGYYARDVLEVMPDASAGDALRTAAGTLPGNARIGVINSLGARRDAQAVPLLKQLAAGPGTNEGALASAALLALGRIATPEAGRAVAQALVRGAAGLRPAAAEACLLAADRWLGEGKRVQALAHFEAVRGAEVPIALRAAATRGAILARESGGLDLLIEQLHSPELAMGDIALRAARELRGANVTPALVAELDKLEPALQALVLTALVDRGEPGVLGAVEARAATANDEVRIAAIKALGKIGGASSLPILFEAIQSSRGEIAAAALASLGRIPARDTDAIILKQVATAQSGVREKLIGVLGDRRAESATPELMRLALQNDGETSKAALRALGVVARPDELPQLIHLALAVREEAAKTLADRAIVTTAMKMIEPERRADAVLAEFRGASDPATKAALLRPLGAIVRSMGGSHEVFFAVRAALRETAEPVREAALRCLAQWPDATPATTLLALAANEGASEEEREVALRGALRMAADVAGGREVSSLDALECFVQAARVVRTREEKLMLVSGLGSVRRPEALRLLQPYLEDAEVQTEAALAVVQIAPALTGTRSAPALNAALERIAATVKDEDIRRKAARLAKGETAPPAAKKKAPKAGKRNAAVAANANAGGASAGRQVLFNGKNLAGWDGDPAVWRVRDGVIVGGTMEGNPRNEFLATKKSYGDFVLRLEYKLVGTEGFVNGGVQFRSVRVAQPPNEMSGYQADIGAGHSGSLYDESRRKKFLARATDEQVKRLEKSGEWNRYEIRCEGSRVELTLNGERTVVYSEADATVARAGRVALQIHGKCKAGISFRNLEIEELR